MIFGVAQIVADVSQYMTLLPGDVITTGTPPGVAHGNEAARCGSRPGDVDDARHRRASASRSRRVVRVQGKH